MPDPKYPKYSVRKPTRAEWEGIIVCLAEYQKVAVDDKELNLDLQLCYVSVLDGYITDTPNYAGVIFTILWSGYPTFHTMIGKSEEKYFMIFDYCDAVNFPLPYSEEEEGGK